MANPKTTITITLDPSMLDAINSSVAALNRLADELANHNSVKLDDEIITGTIKLPETVKFDDVKPAAAPHAPVMPDPVPAAAPIVGTGSVAVPGPAGTAMVGVPTMLPADDVKHPPFSMPVMQSATPPAAPVMPTTQPSVEYTMEQLGRAGADLMTRGVNASGVLQEFGIMSLDMLPKEQYGAFAQRLRQLGANI